VGSLGHTVRRRARLIGIPCHLRLGLHRREAGRRGLLDLSGHQDVFRTRRTNAPAVRISKDQDDDDLSAGRLDESAQPKSGSFLSGVFLPQFIDPASPAKVPAFLLLGLTFVVTGTLWCLTLAFFSAAIGTRLHHSRNISQWLNKALGSLFVFPRSTTSGRPLTRLSASYDPDNLDPVALVERPLRPLVPMQGEAVVLDQNGLRRQMVRSYEVRHRFRAPRIGVLAVQGNRHAGARA